jgi:uncharacterized membrane protein YdbT with pleckstrin-like domain
VQFILAELGAFVSYIDQNLMNGEKVLYQGKFHWVMFLRPSILFMFSMICIDLDSSKRFGFIVFLLAIASIIDSIINYMTSEFVITNNRVIIKAGFIQRISLELLLLRVESVSVKQGILGRLLGYGSLMITGAGKTKEIIPNIDAPMEFRERFQRQVTYGVPR